MRHFLLSPEAADELSLALDAQQPSAEPRADSDPMARFRGGSLRVENGIALIDVAGAMSFDRSLLSQFLATIFGGTLIPELQSSLRKAQMDASIRGVLLKVNSPGGDVAGTEETARMVRELSKQKPVIAFVESGAASAAYWVASAASKVVAQGKTTGIGSIGVVAVVRDARERDQKAGVKTFQVVSSQSPKKRPDMETVEGRDQIQQMVDGLANVFIESVAAYRGVSTEQVQREFGQGDVLRAEQALAAGMIDQIGSEDDAMRSLAEMSHKGFGAAPAANSAERKGVKMETTPAPDRNDQALQESAIRAEATQAERQRIAAILNSPEAKGREPLAQHLALETGSPAESAIGILGKTPKQSGLAAAMSHVPNPNVQPGDDSPNAKAEEDALIKQVVSLANSNLSKGEN